MSDMIQLTTKQASIMAAIEAKPGIQYAEIIAQSGITHGTVSQVAHKLLKKGMVVREGAAHSYKYYSTGKEYEVSDKVKAKIRVASSEPDKLIELAGTVKLTEEQKFYVKNHKHVPRSKMAARLGMSKLEFNFALAMSR